MAAKDLPKLGLCHRSLKARAPNALTDLNIHTIVVRLGHGLAFDQESNSAKVNSI